ncbi:MAG TPA: hypothetical protein VFE62_13965, partial [Gemmataceae bacterium]|nr:hypothetical protein [Gemmataceae bacterium]
DVIVFFAKVIDYLALNTAFLRRDLVLAFMSCFQFEHTGLAACLGLGIHPIAPSLRPLPLLVDNARRMQNSLDNGLSVQPTDRASFDDFCATLNRLSLTLGPMDINHRCDFFSDTSMLVRAIGGLPTGALCDDLRAANAECSRLLELFRAAQLADRSVC